MREEHGYEKKSDWENRFPGSAGADPAGSAGLYGRPALPPRSTRGGQQRPWRLDGAAGRQAASERDQHPRHARQRHPVYLSRLFPAGSGYGRAGAAGKRLSLSRRARGAGQRREGAEADPRLPPRRGAVVKGAFL